jgi:hypothetical protein
MEEAIMFRVGIVSLAMLSALAVPMTAHAEIGICCFPDGSCIQSEEEECWAMGGCDFIPGAD